MPIGENNFVISILVIRGFANLVLVMENTADIWDYLRLASKTVKLHVQVSSNYTHLYINAIF